MKKRREIVTSCDGCGKCCQSQESPPGFCMYLPTPLPGHEDEDDARRVAALPAELRAELLRYLNRQRAGLRPFHPTWPACPWYDAATQRCAHHALRPQICREFEVGCEVCRKLRAQ